VLALLAADRLPVAPGTERGGAAQHRYARFDIQAALGRPLVHANDDARLASRLL